MDLSASHYFITRVPSSQTSFLFLPPVPPPLGSEIPLLAPVGAGPPAPRALSAQVNELYYPLLAARLEAQDLPGAVQAKLEAYQAAKNSLLAELRLRISSLADADAGTREKELTDLANSQAQRIADLEAGADKLRSDLRMGGGFGLVAEIGNLTDRPAIRLPAAHNSPPSDEDLHLEAGVVRRAAFFQDGLAADQRRLLCEAAIGLETKSAERGRDEPSLLQLSPEPARIRLPADLPEPMAKRVSDYASEKEKLKKELLDAFREDGDVSESARIEKLRKLAVSQAPRLRALTDEAEAIRRDLATLPDPPGPPAPQALPPELAARISVYRRHKIEVLRTLRALLAGDAEVPVPAQRDSGDLNLSVLSWLHDGTTRADVQASSLRESVEEFNRTQQTLIAGLNSEQAGIREALSEYMRATDAPTGQKSINDLLKDFEDASQKQELWDKYREYHEAVLMPGLSPGQRRLLFDAAVEQLALPLPPGEPDR